MGEGVLDSRLTKHRYVLMLEPKRVTMDVNNAGQSDEEFSTGVAHISNVGVVLSRYLEHPVTSLVWTDDSTSHQISQSGMFSQYISYTICTAICHRVS